MAFTLEIGSKAPDFSLQGTDNRKHVLSDFSDADILVIFFSCYHCPFVINSAEITRQTADKYKNNGVRFVEIAVTTCAKPNNEITKPEDDFEKMKERMETHKFPWTYLHDETHNAAKKYGAVRTPHFFVFDKDRNLQYAGRGVDSPRIPEDITENTLEMVLSDMVQGKSPHVQTTDPIGCTIKWEGLDAHLKSPDSCDVVNKNK